MRIGEDFELCIEFSDLSNLPSFEWEVFCLNNIEVENCVKCFKIGREDERTFMASRRKNQAFRA